MKNKSVLLCMACSFFWTLTSYADASVFSRLMQLQWHPVIGVGGGSATTTNLGRTTFFPLLNPITDEYYTYTSRGHVQTQGLFEAFLGAEHAFFKHGRLQGGFAYAQTGVYREQGLFIQGADAQSADQYSYKYNALTRQLLAQAKFMYSYNQHVLPFVLLGLGSSFNTASQYSTNVPSFLTFTREYMNHTSSTFAYRVGVGADLNIATQLRLGLAYRFSDLGGVQLGSTTINQMAVSGTLGQSNVYANEVLAQLTYIM